MCQRRQNSRKLARAVRAVEVLREDEAHQQRQADRDVGVAREVAVDLRRVAVGGAAPRRARVGLAARRRPGRRSRARGSRRATTFLTSPSAISTTPAPTATSRGSRGVASWAGTPGRGRSAPRRGAGRTQVDRDVDRARRLAEPALDVDDVGDRLEGEEAEPTGSAIVSSGSGAPRPTVSRTRSTSSAKKS